jgi:hypothetical protein
MKSLLSTPGKAPHGFGELLKTAHAAGHGPHGPGAATTRPPGLLDGDAVAKDGEDEAAGGKPGHGLRGKGSHEEAPHAQRRHAEAPLDPAARQAAYLGPPPSLDRSVLPGPVPAEVTARRASASLEELLPSLVRKVGWSGDGRKGTVRLELGAGALAGGTLLVHAEDGRVRVHLTAPSGASLGEWKDRISERLAARGLTVDEVEVE